MATIAEWLKSVTNNTKSNTYKAPAKSTSAAAGKQAAADSQINSTKSSTKSGSATNKQSLTKGQIQTIGDAATRKAGGDTRAGAAAVAQAQSAVAKTTSNSDAQKVYQQTLNNIYNNNNNNTSTKVVRENPPNPWEQANPARSQLTHDTYANRYNYQNNLPKTSDYEYSSRYQAPSNDLREALSNVVTDIVDQFHKEGYGSSGGSRGSGNSGNSGNSGDSGGSGGYRDYGDYNGSGNFWGSGSSSSSSSSSSSGGFGGSGNTVAAAQLILGLPVEAQRAALAEIQSLADLYGIDYNRDSIEGVFKDATNAAHEANLKEYNRTARQYYDKLGATQNSLIDTLRKQRAASITSGANAGMQNATELSEILGLTQTVSPDALALAQDRNALIEAYNAQLAQDVRDAMEYSDQLKQALAALASEKYGYDAQQYVAELSHNANVQAQNTASSAAYTGNKYATLEDILGLAVVPSLTYTKKE